MHLASPRISSLPILHLVLLLLAHYTTQAQGMNLHYFSYIKEIETILNKPVPSQPPQNDVNSNEKFILRNENFLKINLHEFLEAAKHLTDRGKKIGENLENFKTVLPNTTSMEHRIHIEKGNWDDFRRKLKEYLKALRNFFGF